MLAGEPAHQPVHLGQCGRGIDIVEDQQPPGIGAEPSQHGVEPYLLLGRLVLRQHQRPGKARQVAPQFLRRIGLGEQQRRVVRAIGPGIFDRGSRLADAAHPVERLADDRRGTAIPACQALVQPAQKRLAALEQAAKAGIGQPDWLGVQLLRPRLLQYLGAQLVSVGEWGVMQLRGLDVPDESRLQFGKIVAARPFPVRAIVGSGDVQRQPPLIGAGEEELPLGKRGFCNPRREQMLECRRRGRRRAVTAARADHANDGAALANVIVQQPQQGVRARLLAEAALHPQLQVARLQVVRHRIARRAELARHRREKDAKLRRHRPPAGPGLVIRPQTREQRNVRSGTRPSWRHDRGV
jgi:hypothetical protein